MEISRRQFVAALAACPACAAAGFGARADGAHWTYEDPARWGADSVSKACSVGDQQSPIDLKDAIRADIEPPAPSWGTGVFKVVNNGHTIQVNVPPGGFVTSGGRRYELTQFHFHTPSEHALDGKRSAMEAHFVHADEAGHLAVLGVFLEGAPSEASPVFAAIMRAAPKTPGEAPLDTPIDPLALVPENRRFFRYEGSLTTPPCSEVVEWTVFAAPVPVAQVDIDAFKAIFPMNARPLQAAERRFVLTD